jgi:hypothetical protein
MRRLGEWLTKLTRKNYDRRWLFGCVVRSVSFADHRSGWAAILVQIGFGPWCWSAYPIWWRPEYRPAERVVTLAEQMRANHPDPDDEDESEP